jgi:hypothetical protein
MPRYIPYVLWENPRSSLNDISQWMVENDLVFTAIQLCLHIPPIITDKGMRSELSVDIQARAHSDS